MDAINTALDNLTSEWFGTYETNLAELENYYKGTHPKRLLSTKQLQNTEYNRFWTPTNLCRIVIDETIGYLANGRIRIESENQRVTDWANDYYQRRIKARMADLVRWQGLYAESFTYLWTDLEGQDRGLKVRALAPIEGGEVRVKADYGGQDDEEITAAKVYYKQPQLGSEEMVKYVATLTLDRIRIERQVDEKTSVVVFDEPNTARVLPIIPFLNIGESDILTLTPIQDRFNKLIFDLNMIREYHGFPLITAEPIVTPDGRAIEIPANLQVGPGRMLRNGKFSRIETSDIEPVLSERKALLEEAAMAVSSLVLLERSGGNPSGIAMRFFQQSLESKVVGKAQHVETGLKATLEAAARIIATSPELMKLETDGISADELRNAYVSVSVDPAIPADEEGNAKRADLFFNKLGGSQQTAFGIFGIESPKEEQERAQKEAEAERAPALVVAGEMEGEDA